LIAIKGDETLRKKIALLVVLCLAFGLLAGCGQADNGKAPDTSADTSWQEIQDKGYFIVGLDDAFPPMGFRDENNEIVGFDIDLAKATAEKLGLEVEFKPINWDSKMLELDGKNIDLIWNGFSVTPEREEQVLFTKPYLENKQIIVTLKDSGIKTKADLAGKKVGLQGGSSSEDALKKDEATFSAIGEKNIMRYKDNNAAMMDLDAGRVKAVVLDEVVCRYYISKKTADYVILDEHFGEEKYAVGARLNDKSFVVELQKALDELKTNGTATQISKKWFGEDVVK